MNLTPIFKIHFALYFAIFLTACSNQKLKEITTDSPDQNIKVKFELINNQPFYSVYYKETCLLLPSKLGFEFKNQAALDSNFLIQKVETSTINENWEQVWGENKKVKNNYNQSIVYLKEISEPGRPLKLQIKVYNDGIGFRYEIPEHEGVDSLFISNELTEFNFANNYKAWWIPANFDSYESLYSNNKISDIPSANTPFTLETKDGVCISIHEANLTNYAGMTLKKVQGSSTAFKAELVPWPDGTKVKTKAPMLSPWRTIQIASSAAELAESNLILNLNEPNKIANVSWIQPMKYIGIWWGMHLGVNTWTLGERHGATTENMKKYIDFAAEHNIPAVLAEGWNTGWENWGAQHAFDFITPYEDFDLEAIADYAKNKGVQLIGHHETGGDAEYYEQKLEEAFSMYQRLGIKVVKTGYAGPIRPLGQHHHGQWMVNHYQKVVETAAKYHIMIDAHEPIKATGIRRTWPNMMTREGARGMEWNGWSDGNPPEHHTILPFTRNLAGPIDYTPGIFDIQYKNAGKRVKWNDHDKGTSRVNTTLAKQLSLFVVFYSPLQMASDLIENYKDQPAFQFIEDVPVDWAETKVLNAQIGDYVTIARKDINSNDWFLGSITDENARTLEINLNFLDKDKSYIAEIYSDSENTDWKTNPIEIDIRQLSVNANDTIKLRLAPGGGQAIRFKVID